jgi:putative phage-type endonuclease
MEVETALLLMNEYLQQHIDQLHHESFTEDMIREVRELMEVQLEEPCEDEIAKALFLFKGRTCYSYPPLDGIPEIIDKLRNKPQPKQKTPEWYEYRHRLITASSAYKALGTPAKINELIKSKSKPVEMYASTNTEGPMHWGVKYEPVSIQYYQYEYKTKVEEFGCITHDTYTFLGASPDGINVDETSPLYGRMLEIKNPFTRDITGNPKVEYWVQCQVQMEVCDLNACDFVETKFVEYENEDAFRADGSFSKTSDGKYKGIILQFFTDKVSYEYAPFQCSEEEYKVWEETSLSDSQRTWVKTMYWKLDVVSKVIIPRHTTWFECMIPKFIEVMQSLPV